MTVETVPKQKDPAAEERSWIARQKAWKVLGYAVHPAALNRLFELAPEAIVRVRHNRTWHDARQTVVYIQWVPGNRLCTKYGAVTCHSSDQYVKRVGIDKAFRQALKKLATETS